MSNPRFRARRSAATAATIAFLVLTDASAVEIRAKGFLKMEGAYATRAVNSSGQENLIAPTAARPRDAGFSIDDHGVSSLQGAQSRIGAELLVDPRTQGYLEFDFVDFAKASPTAQMVPRLRIAKIERKLDERLKLAAGLDWDVFSPLGTISYNYIGNGFQTGNAGFMRQQFVLNDTRENVEFRYALGMAGSNPTATTSDLEKSALPSFAASVAFRGEGYRWGASALGGLLTFRDPASAGRARRAFYGGNLFAERTAERWQLRGEAYFGQNLENTGAQTLSRGRLDASLREAGGYLTAKRKLGERWAVFGTVGFAEVLNADAVSVDTTVAAGRRSFAASTLGIVRNRSAKLGADYALSDRLALFAEASHFQTRYRAYGLGRASVFNLGLLLGF